MAQDVEAPLLDRIHELHQGGRGPGVGDEQENLWPPVLDVLLRGV